MEDLIYSILATLILLLYPVWRIHKRAGINPFASLALFVPYVGMLIVALNLCLSQWDIQKNEEVGQ